jgi:hypothetical protein
MVYLQNSLNSTAAYLCTIVMTVFSHWLHYHKVEVGTLLHWINYIKSGSGLLRIFKSSRV